MKDEYEMTNWRTNEGMESSNHRIAESTVQCSDDPMIQSHKTRHPVELRNSSSCFAFAFTLVELMVVIIIIALLISILIPTIGHVERAAYATRTRAQLGSIEQAISQYYSDFHAYPGPVSNQVMGTNPNTGSANYIYQTGGGTGNLVTSLTGSEDLVLGLIGGLKYQTTGTAGIYYDPSYVGQGPTSLNTAMPHKYGHYIDTSDLSADFNGVSKDGHYKDGAGSATDSNVPEILDRFPDRMPILFLRANQGATMMNPGAALSDTNNPVVIDGTKAPFSIAGSTSPVVRPAAYDISQITAYTKSTIGEGKTGVENIGSGTTKFGHGLQSVGDSAGNLNVLNQTEAGTINGVTYDYVYPYAAYGYFKDPNSPDYNTSGGTTTYPYAREKDSYILISAGPDRIYGTKDDITSFGNVNP